eukprot:TRINITY_DN25483_c0_g1_i1.p1 TRINITY_DN25483_c0_g1~~TRINITY_DN25483_c0_g1_i1.p1  ORF type:complete len:200 (-),score=49.02 TRINITY_DN25483_c0_g1_i1:160-732(-)
MSVNPPPHNLAPLDINDRDTSKKVKINPPGVSVSDIVELQEIFKSLGGNWLDKTIPLDSLLATLQARQSKGGHDHVMMNYLLDAVKALKKSNPDMRVLSFERFTEICSFSVQDPKSLDKRLIVDLEKVFELFDEEGKGGINLNDLQKIVNDLGEPLSEDEVEDMIKRADQDNDGLVNKSEFIVMMNKKPL